MARMQINTQINMRAARLTLTVLLLTSPCLVLAPSLAQGRAHERPPARLAGTYTRVKQRGDENQSAILDITQISRGRIKFHLTALWWSVGRGDSPHNGEIEATVALRDHAAIYQNGGYRLRLRFQARPVVVTESGSNPDFGVNVSAAGTYRRTRRNKYINR